MECAGAWELLSILKFDKLVADEDSSLLFLCENNWFLDNFER